MELIRLENVTKAYRLGEVEVPVLRDISLSIFPGEMVALMGASGSGKTTLMNILGCLDRPSSGRYWLDGQEMSLLAPNQRALVRTAKLGFVFQNFNLLPRTTAVQNVVMPLDYAPHRPAGRLARRYARRLLGRLGLANHYDYEPSQMSGGQQQRVAIARALANHPAVLLADEPTGNLDSQTSVEILRMFQQLNAEGITVLLVTHDAGVAAYAHRTIRIVDGRITADEVAVPLLHAGHGIARAHRGRASGPPWLRGGLAALPPAARRASAPHAADDGPPVAADDTGPPSPDGSRTGAPLADGPLADGPRPGFGPRRGAGRRRPPAGYRPRGPLFPATLRTSFRSLRRNKLRSALTALGVILGVAAVIAMTEIGQGSKTAMQKTIATAGANNLLILPAAAMSGSVSLGTGSVQTLKPEDMDEILRQCPAVEDIAPVVWSRAQVVYGNRNWVPGNMSGTTPGIMDVRGWEVVEGQPFSDRDVRNASKVCLIGATVEHELFPDESPVGKEVRIRNVPFQVVGVLGPKGANMYGQDQDDIVLAPWTTIKFRINGSGAGSLAPIDPSLAAAATINTLDNLYPGGTPLYPVPSAEEAFDMPHPFRLLTLDVLIAKAVSPEQIPEAIDEITGLLRQRHRLGPERDDDFEIRDLTEINKMRSSASELMGALLLVVAAISLVVGGVGIMNIMLVSVTERTREIGLRMAVGARSHHILRQFLTEAVLLCLVGGGVGIAVGRGVSILVRSVKHWPTQASLPAILVAVLVAAGVGIVFGFYPAWKASRLDPIQALRYE
ncbi:MAG: ABC transporter permease [Thermoguttaceae bacterium]|jgi:ABC-type lipoprotein export system ATPase subunit/ABC-type antimicrobial peptide transport system permease subunit